MYLITGKSDDDDKISARISTLTRCIVCYNWLHFYPVHSLFRPRAEMTYNHWPHAEMTNAALLGLISFASTVIIVSAAVSSDGMTIGDCWLHAAWLNYCCNCIVAVSMLQSQWDPRVIFSLADNIHHRSLLHRTNNCVSKLNSTYLRNQLVNVISKQVREQ